MCSLKLSFTIGETFRFRNYSPHVPDWRQFKTRNGTLIGRSSRADSFLPVRHSPGQKIVGSFYELHSFSFPAPYEFVDKSLIYRRSNRRWKTSYE